MESSDEEDVYMGTLSLTDIKKILMKMDPFKKEDSAGESHSDTEEILTEDPFPFLPDKVLSEEPGDTSSPEIMFQNMEFENDVYAAPLKVPLNDTKHWAGLVNNISTSHNIFDQTEPEVLLQRTLMENTLIPDVPTSKHRKCNLTILEQPEWQNESIGTFEAMEQLTRSPTKPVRAEVDHQSSSDFSQMTSEYETAQGSFEISEQSHLAKDVFITAQNTSDDSGTNRTGLDGDNSSLDFDNTFEEMKYYLELDTKLKDDAKLKTPQHTKTSYPSFSPVTPTDSPSAAGSAISARRIRTKGSFYSPPKSLHQSPEFRVPKTPNSCLSKHLVKSPLQNYDHIVSPIGLYIKNAASVPLLGNHNPAKNVLQKKKPIGAGMTSTNEKHKENVVMGSPHSLPPKAYKSSSFNTVTTVKSPCALSSLTKNDKVKKLISNTPTHKVIRHEGRLKESKLPRLRITKPDDSFADLSISSADLSVLVKKEAIRTETLKKTY